MLQNITYLVNKTSLPSFLDGLFDIGCLFCIAIVYVCVDMEDFQVVQESLKQNSPQSAMLFGHVMLICW